VRTGRIPTRVVLVVGLLVALLLAGVVSHYASDSPDGLERVAADQGFSDTAREHAADGGPLADYRTRGIGDGRIAGGLAGVVGTVVVLGAAGGLALLLRRRERRAD
jgi:cobalt/nickel transport system permease protein/cobalt/nickel transport protein